MKRAGGVRLATSDDVLPIVEMVDALRAAIGGPIPVDRAWTARTVAGLIASESGYVAVAGDGFIAGAITQTIISPDLIAQELGWFSRSKTGLVLLRSFEAWARDKGATLIQLSTAPGMDISRLGYRRAEQAWVK